MNSLKFKTCLLAVSAVVIFSSTTRAAGPASYDWTGWYVGAHVGYGFGSGKTDFTPLPSAATFFDLAPTSLSPNPEGVIGGGQFGINIQRGCFVLGMETDISGSAMEGTKELSPIIGITGLATPGVLRSHEHIHWFGTVRPRLGYTVTPTVLLYGTGGLAYGNEYYSANSRGLFEQYPASVSDTKVGWTAGAGVEYAIGRCWSVKAEYLYCDLGHDSAIASPIPSLPPFQIGYRWETTFHTINVGFNYKFQ
jgi:outer membrane immunogenic protein